MTKFIGYKVIWQGQGWHVGSLRRPEFATSVEKLVSLISSRPGDGRFIACFKDTSLEPYRNTGSTDIIGSQFHRAHDQEIYMLNQS